MKIKTIDLIEQLQADVRQLILTANYLQKEETGLLVLQPVAGKWSVAQVLEHLNSYGQYYLPAIEKSIRGNNQPPQEWFKQGWLGNYFTKIMKPGKDGKIANKMNSPKDHQPSFVTDSKRVLTAFIEQQYHLLNLLEEGKTTNIGKIRVPISISKFITLKAGDTFRFLIAHEQRHFVQISNVLAELRLVTGKFQVVHPAA